MIRSLLAFLFLLSSCILFAGRLPERDAWISNLRHPAPLERYQPSVANFEHDLVNSASTSDPLLSSPTIEQPPLWQAYSSLAGPNGFFYDARDQDLPAIIPQLFQHDIPNQADVVILMDHTSSMGDDIDSMRVLLSELQAQLRSRPGIRLGAVTFSDLKQRPQIGYRALPLGKSHAAIDAFFGATPLIGSIEDMYGSIAKTLAEFNWRPGVSRRLIVISDEAPAEAPDSDYSMESVHQMCVDSEPEAVLHVILLEKD